MSQLHWLFQSGMRKVTVLGGLCVIAELAAVGALFSGHLPATEWTSFTIQLVGFGGGIFTAGNALEHLSKLPERAKELAKP